MEQVWAELLEIRHIAKPCPLAETQENKIMEIRQIKINGHSQVETLKIYILQKLKLIDHKRNNLEEFEEKLKNYLKRNSKLKIELILDNALFEKDLKFDLKISSIDTKPYPDNYEFGNPLNRWIIDGNPLTEEESKIKDLNFEQKVKDAIEKFDLFFEWIENLGQGQIQIEKQ